MLREALGELVLTLISSVGNERVAIELLITRDAFDNFAIDAIIESLKSNSFLIHFFIVLPHDAPQRHQSA